MAKLLHLVSDVDNYVVNPSRIDSISGDTDALIFSGSSVATVAGVTTVALVGAITDALRDLNRDAQALFVTVNVGGDGITVAEVGAA